MAESLENKLEWLEGSVNNLNGFIEADTKKSVWEEAKLKTLALMLQEVCAKLGVSDDDFRSHYQARVARFVGLCYDKMEDSSSSIAARLDDRPIWLTDTEEPLTPLFPD